MLGPRQCGKTTLARRFAEDHPGAFFDLENPVDRARLEHPLRALEGLEGLVVIDEFQRRPDLFDVLHVLIDRPESAARFLVLGSASPQLVRGVSESLAGRVGFVDLVGFDLDEVGLEDVGRPWLRGGFPRSFLATDEEASVLWREGLVRTFLERDIPQLGISTLDALQGHPKLGASWEGFALEQILARAHTRDAYYRGTQGGAELDLLLFHAGARHGFELKYVDAPRSTRSMRVAIADLALDHLWVIYPGTETYPIDDGITALPLGCLRAVGPPFA